VVIRPSLLALPLLFGAIGCDRACERDKPYVPYAIDTDGGALALGADGASVAPDEDAGGGVVAPPGATRWTLGGRTVDAPSGHVFGRALTGDFDADGVIDIVVTVRHREEKLLATVFYHPGKGAPVELVGKDERELPDASCTPSERLSPLGKTGVLADVSAVCAGHAATALPRSISLFALDKGAPRQRFAAKIGDVGLPLWVGASTEDRDHDGVDDLTLRFALEPPREEDRPEPRGPELVLGFLDRPAGLTRDPETPEESLRAFAKNLDVRSGKGKAGQTVPDGADAMRQLYRAVCPDTGAPRVRPTAGAFTCGPSVSLDAAELAVVRSFALYGEPLRAIHALERMGRPPLVRSRERLAEAERLVDQVAPVRPGRLVKAVLADPDATGPGPAYGPLTFDPKGLLVLSHGAVIRVDAKGDEVPTKIAPWVVAANTPDGSRLLEAYDPCDGTFLHLTFGDGTATRDAELPIAPELGVPCAAKGQGQKTTLLGTSPRGLELLVGALPVSAPWGGGKGEWLAGKGIGSSPPGSARSSQGRFYAALTSRGVVVRGERTVTVRAPELADVSFCTVDDEGRHLGCLRKGRAVLVEF
jgi:hypothetical protein